MSAQSFELVCPACKSVVPADARGCPNCDGRGTPKLAAAETVAAPAAAAPPDVASMGLKDYHRLVRANYAVVEVPQFTGRSGGSRVRAYLPFALLLIGLLVGAAIAFGRL
jgi:hypothetical protein